MSLPPELETLKHEAQLVSVGTWAEIRGWKLSKGTDRAGPCPVCGGTDRFAIHIGKQTFNCRRCGISGEGVIKLVMLTEGLEFVPACELITGRSVATAVDPGRAAELAQENARREREREIEEARRRQQAIADGLRIWEKSAVPGPAHTGGVADYLALRGLPAMDWAKVPLREIMAHPYLVQGADGRGWQTIHTGPAMIAAVVLPDGSFGAVHQTWLDIHQVKGKLILPPDDKGRERPAKKVRGSKKGGAIKLYTPMTRRRLIMGEGIETTGTAMTHNFERETAYWAGVDLGNMSGKAYYDLAGKRQEGLPDMIDEDCFLPPDWVEELVYLCDGDEVSNKTVEKVQRGLLRAQALRDRARAERPELPALDCWMVEPDAGGDLNDLVRGGSLVANTPDDDNPVKKAMSRKRPVKGSFTVIPGGMSEDDFELYGEPIKPQRQRKTKASSDDDGDERPSPPDGAYDDQDAPPGGHDPAELEGARHCAPYDQNDRDNARRLIYWFGLDLAYVPGMGWVVFRDTHWVRDDAELEVALRAQTVVDMIKLEALVLEHSPGAIKLLAAAKALDKKPAADWSSADHKLARSADSVQKALGERKSKRRAFAVTSGNRGRTVAMVAQAASMKAVDPKVLDANHMKFNLLNGTLTFSRVLDPEREEGSDRLAGHIEFVDHPERADMITKVADVEYDPDAECPEFMKFLATVQPDPVMRQFLQVGHAYAMLMGGNDEQVVFFHYGSGANGKSVFIEALGRLAGGYRAVVSPETFTGDQQKQGQQASPDIARLVNTRFVTVEELPRGVALKENMIKAASGGTKMVARFLQKEFFEFDPIFTTIMSGNDMPSVGGTDYGIWRRLKIIPWGYTVPEADRRPFGDMMKALDAERSGILNWLLDGLMLYLSVGLTPYIPATVRAFTEDYREERDPVGNFVESCLIAKPGHEVNASDMFKAYEKWCEANAVKPYQQTAFGLRLNALGIKKKKGRTYSYLDVKLGDVPDIADPRPAPPSPAADDPGWSPSQL